MDTDIIVASFCVTALLLLIPLGIHHELQSRDEMRQFCISNGYESVASVDGLRYCAGNGKPTRLYLVVNHVRH